MSEQLNAILPTDCPLDLDSTGSLPNADRAYRSGVHQGIDFICGERGMWATAALPGRAVTVMRSYDEPSVEERNSLLGTAAELGETPPWLLAMLFGNFVVIDHGLLEGIGHVVTVYAHLESVDEAVRPGVALDAGQRLGEIGNTGTATAAADGDRPQSLHLHWEIHVDNVFLGASLAPGETRRVYALLFSG